MNTTDFFSCELKEQVPICLVVDTSHTMNKKSNHNGDVLKCEQVYIAVKHFLDDTIKNDLISNIFDICIISCGGEKPRVINDFSTASKINFPNITPNGRKPLGMAIELALDLLEERKEYYKKNKIGNYEPILIILSDAQPAGLDYGFINSIERCKRAVYEWKLIVVTFAVGDSARLDLLDKFCPEENTCYLEKESIFSKTLRFWQGFMLDKPMSADDPNIFSWLDEEI